MGYGIGAVCGAVLVMMAVQTGDLAYLWWGLGILATAGILSWLDYG